MQGKKMTHEEYVAKLAKIKPTIEVLGSYVKGNIEISHKCKNCNHEWEIAPHELLKGRQCPKCSLTRKKTHEEYITEVAKLHPNIKVLGTYVGAKTKILHECEKGHQWMTTPARILEGKGCYFCKGNTCKTQETYINELKKINPHISVLGTYVGAKTKILHRCNNCNSEWETTPSNLLSKHYNGCPYCSEHPSFIGPAPLYKNSIWASGHKDFFSYYLTEEQMQNFMPHSNRKIIVNCPSCKITKQISPSQMLHRGFSCKCKNNQSYPNKFLYNLLEQLHIDYIPEKTFVWSNKKIYDIYIPSLQCIIENHGEQHYKDNFVSRQGLKQEQKNDKYKHHMAINNNIKHYITIDCRKSEYKWMQKSIIKSKLLDVLEVNIEEINWKKCHEFALSIENHKIIELLNNGISIKEVMNSFKISRSTINNYLRNGSDIGLCLYPYQKLRMENLKNQIIHLWNKGLKAPQIAKSLDISHATVSNYLNQAHKNGLCDYSSKEVFKRKNNNKPSFYCYCLETNRVFKSIKNARIATGSSLIGECCRGQRDTTHGYHWYYLYDHTRKDGTTILGAISLGLIAEQEALKQLIS